METGKYNGVVDDYKSFLTFLDALAVIISEMFGNHCEVVISDLDNPQHSVLSIYNGHVTGRKVGDPLNTRSGIVTKAFGRNISFCINYDCDDLTALQSTLKKFLSMGDELYDEFEEADNGELAEHKFMIELEKMNKPIVSMNKKDRIQLIKNLKEAGVFKIQKSVPYIAEQLGLSRYTIYNYLNEIEKNEDE